MTFADVLPIARQLTPAEKLRLVRILIDELDASDIGDAAIVNVGTNAIFTPLGQNHAAADLLAAFPDVVVPGPETSTVS